MRFYKHFAFTLIEILIILAILAILTSSAFLFIPFQLKKARDARRKIDLNLIKKSLEEYYDLKNHYPASLPSCHNELILENIKFMSETPCDPKTKTNYLYISDGTSVSKWFKIYTTLENLNDSNIDIVDCRAGCGPECQYNYGVHSTNTILDNCTPNPIQYACIPGGGQEGECSAFDDPDISECPITYPNDPTCKNECSNHDNRCKNAKGKHIPD